MLSGRELSWREENVLTPGRKRERKTMVKKGSFNLGERMYHE